MSIEYGTQTTPAQLALLADDWTRELSAENPASVAEAFDLHRRECSRFPTLAHVLALMPRCRVCHKNLAALPEQTESDDWRDRVRTVRAALAGDAVARAKMDALVHRVMGNCTAGGAV